MEDKWTKIIKKIIKIVNNVIEVVNLFPWVTSSHKLQIIQGDTSFVCYMDLD